jgi:hypothetical protein
MDQDHRFVMKRLVASKSFRFVDVAVNRIEGYEAINIIRKGQIGWLPKGEIVDQMLVKRTLASPAHLFRSLFANADHLACPYRHECIVRV